MAFSSICYGMQINPYNNRVLNLNKVARVSYVKMVK